MSPDKTKLKEYAEGWITEREGTEVPKLPQAGVHRDRGGAAAYFFLFMYGEVNHPDRGPLVRAMNAATEASGGLMYAIAALVIIYGIIVVAFALRQTHD